MKRSIKILSAVLVIILSISLFASCGFSPEAMAKATVDEVFRVLQSEDVVEIKSKLGLDEDPTFSEDGFTDEMLLKLFENLDYEINSTEVIDENNVTVNVTVTNTDMAAVLEDFVSEVTTYALSNITEISEMTDEEMQAKSFEILNECMNKEDLKTTTSDIDMHVYCEDGVWDIDAEDTVIDALLGGFVSASSNLDF